MNQIKKISIRPLYNVLMGMRSREMPSTMAFTIVEILRYLEGLLNELEEEIHKVALECGEATEVPGEVLFKTPEAQQEYTQKKTEVGESLVELTCPKIRLEDLKDVRLTPSEAMALEVLI